MPSIFPFEPVTAVKTKQGRTTRASCGEVGHHNPDAEATDSESDSSSEEMRVQCTSSEAAGSGIQQDDVYKVCNCNQYVQGTSPVPKKRSY